MSEGDAATHGGWRTGIRFTRHGIAMVLVLVATLLAPIGLVGFWVREEIVDRDEFVESVAPLIEDREIQDAMVRRWSGRIEEIVEREAPGLLTQEQIASLLTDVVRSDSFDPTWRAAVRAAHPQLERVLTGRDTDLLRTSNGRVIVDVGAVAEDIERRLVAAGYTQAAQFDVSTLDFDLPVYHSRDLVRFQRFSDLAVRYGVWAIGAWAVAVALVFLIAPHRRRALVWLAVGSVVGASVAGVGLVLARLRYHARLERLVPPEVSERAFDILVRPIEVRIRIWFVIAAVLVVVGLLLSPTRRELRTPVRPDISALRRWIAGHVVDLSVSVLALAAAVLAWWQSPTATVVVVVALAAAAGIVAVVVTGRWRTRQVEA